MSYDLLPSYQVCQAYKMADLCVTLSDILSCIVLKFWPQIFGIKTF